MDESRFMDSMDLKVRELLKEVQLDYSPQFTELVDDTVSAIKASIDKIPEDVKVIYSLFSFNMRAFILVRVLLYPRPQT